MCQYKPQQMNINERRVQKKLSVGFFWSYFCVNVLKCGRQNRNQNASTYSTTVREKKKIACIPFGKLMRVRRTRCVFTTTHKQNKFTHIFIVCVCIFTQTEQKYSRPFVLVFSFRFHPKQRSHNTVCLRVFVYLSRTHTWKTGKAHTHSTQTHIYRNIPTELRRQQQQQQ